MMCFKTVAIIILVILISGCQKESLSSKRTENPEFIVALLFEHEGCKVYRFWDNGGAKYYTNCGKTFWGESCGKNCHKEVGVE